MLGFKHIITKEYLEEGDIEEALGAANAVGDDAIQKRMQGSVVPDSFTTEAPNNDEMVYERL